VFSYAQASAARGSRAAPVHDAETDGLAVIAVLGRGRPMSSVSVLRPRRKASFRFRVALEGLVRENRRPEREEAFLRWWTGKEAFVKAVAKALAAAVQLSVS
jgi:hypothetical protein